MFDTLKKEWQAQVAVFLFLGLAIWWLFGLSHLDSYKHRYFGDYSSIYGFMALWGAIWGIFISRKWGGFKSVMGRAILLLSLGLFAQELGQIIYAYYSFYRHIAVPYPSWGDVGYFGSIPLYIAGVWLLGEASGLKIRLRTYRNQMIAIIIPLAMLIGAYLLFLQHYSFDWSQPIKVFLDFAYPFGQAIYISLAILTYLLSRSVLGGIMKNKILFILFALLVQFLSDYTFLYQSNAGTWQNGGFNEFMYLFAYFLMTLGLIQLVTVYKKLRV